MVICIRSRGGNQKTMGDQREWGGRKTMTFNVMTSMSRVRMCYKTTKICAVYSVVVCYWFFCNVLR